MAKRVYCTYFDHNYLSRGVALYHSLQRHASGSRLWVLCLSEACYNALVALDLPNLVPRSLADFESADPEIAATRPYRSLIEYYFTCSPAWMLFVQKSEPDAEWVTYLDSDLFFFASPEPVYSELKEAAFGIIPHHFTKQLADMRRFGIYNVGWVSVRHCEEGMAALRWWRARCIEWCHDRVEGNRFADQRYLDQLPGMFPNVHVIQHLGADLAPWNFADLRVEWQDEAVSVEGRYPLLFFHFHGVRRVGRYYFNSHRAFHAPFPGVLRQRIYEPYIFALIAAELQVKPYLKDKPKAVRTPAVGSIGDYASNALRRLRSTINRRLDVMTGRAIPIRDVSSW